MLALLLIPLGASGIWIAWWTSSKERQRTATVDVSTGLANALAPRAFRVLFVTLGVFVIAAGVLLAIVSYPD